MSSFRLVVSPHEGRQVVVAIGLLSPRCQHPVVLASITRAAKHHLHLQRIVSEAAGG
jgi:hypothetical protein